jgi:hypothetical protein
MIIADSAPMLTMSASSLIGTNAARSAMSTAPPIVIRRGIPLLVSGTELLRQQAVATHRVAGRPMVTSSTIITEVSPVTSPRAMSAPLQCWPTASNADASGALTSMFVYGTIPVRTKETPM